MTPSAILELVALVVLVDVASLGGLWVLLRLIDVCFGRSSAKAAPS